MLAQIVLFDGFDLLDALAPYEVFVAANAFTEGELDVELVTAEGARMVPSGMTGLEIKASGKLDPIRAQIVLIPGAAGDVVGDGPDSVPAILAQAAETALTPLVQQSLGQPDTLIATVCGGSLILAMGGLLKHRHAVTHHLGMEVLAATGAVPIAARVVQDGNLITGGGVTSGLDVALYIVEQQLGPRIAHAVEQLFEYERRGVTWRAEGLIPVSGAAQPSSHVTPSANDKETSIASSNAAIFDGTWKVTISTPIGKQNVLFQISTKDGLVNGTATQDEERVEFVNPIITGNRMMWSQRITKPMSLELKFDVTINGNTMVGIAKAGLLPRSKVEGTRMA
ncbi:DJ-1/PfpI family protein [Alicyclobacillus fodiniaquatilis]|uniref:DJ-1/PfpI family protein n=1 Tax=Alicyclobacillus fodiniaquatilis TaxID=1661150 RepID=A0ABW4JIT1_9BACL